MTEQEKKNIKAAKAAYMRKWRRENPERETANRERYWLKKAKQMQEENAPTNTEDK